MARGFRNFVYFRGAAYHRAGQLNLDVPNMCYNRLPQNWASTDYNGMFTNDFKRYVALLCQIANRAEVRKNAARNERNTRLVHRGAARGRRFQIGVYAAKWFITHDAVSSANL
jgi:hypothetical protein